MHLISQAEVVELNQRLISLASSSVVESLETDEFLQIFVRRLYSYIPPILKAWKMKVGKKIHYLH